MTFEEALTKIKQGKQMFRAGWNGIGMWVELQTPDEGSKMQRPYIYMVPNDGKSVPWVASQTDLLADDWLEA